MELIEKNQKFLINNNNLFNQRVLYDKRTKYLNYDLFKISVDFYNENKNNINNDINKSKTNEFKDKINFLILTKYKNIYENLLKRTTKSIDKEKVLLRIIETIIRYSFFIKELSN